MATKETVKTENEYETVFVPKTARDDDKLYVAVNGERIMIQKGVSVTVKKKFAEVINNSLEQDRKTDEYISSMTPQA